MIHRLTPQFILDKWAEGQENGRFPAVTLFIDLTGFTSLSANLMRYGKAGAEELANLLQTIFAPLIDSIYANGGFVAGFAGDALKAVFPSHRHNSYIATLTAAQQIQQHMIQNQRLHSTFGSFPFAARISMASGEVIWEIWSTSQSLAKDSQTAAFTFAGSGLDAAIEGESYAQAGEIILTQAVYDVLRQTVETKSKSVSGGHYALTEVVTLPSITPQAKYEPLQKLSDKAIHFYPESLLSRRIAGEFRHVVSLFLNVADLATDFMPTFFSLLQQYGGYLCRIGRGGARETETTFLLFWGAPTAHENDVERALNFILNLQAQTTSPIRAGLTYQMVYAGFVGSSLREEYTCYGLRVNLAVRLMVAANWGEIWLDEEVASRAEDNFRVAFVEKRPFKGFDNPLPVYRLEQAKLQSLAPFFQREMVGREAELERLQTAVQPIFDNQFGGLITVAGEAGIGKSRLVHQFLEQLTAQQTVTVWLCQTDEILRESLNPFRYFLRRYFAPQPSSTETKETAISHKAHFDTKLDALIAATPEPTLQAELERTRSFLGALVGLRWPNSLYEQLAPNMRQENGFIALKNLILAESLQQPLILQLEDSHWLDSDSQQFLAELVRNVADYPFAILTTTRLSEPPLSAPTLPSTLLPLTPLSQAEIARLAEKLLQTAVSPVLTTLLNERTDGNPFFVEQMTHYLQEQQLLESSDAGLVPTTAVSQLPDSLQTILVARIDQLSQAVREVVQTAAVLGREFNVAVLSEMLRGETAVSEKIKTAESAAIWSALTELRYLFRHALLRDAAYDMQIQTHRQQLHQLAAQTIETIYHADLTPYYNDLAFHFGQTTLTAQEAHYAELAGQEAAYQFDNNTAIAHFTRALDLTPNENHLKRYQLLLAREAVYGQLSKRDEQTQAITELHTLADELADPKYKIEILLREADVAAMLSDFPRAAAVAEQAASNAQATQDLELTADALNFWGYALMMQGQLDTAKDTLAQGYELAKANGFDRQQALCGVHLSQLYSRMGSYETGKSFGLEAADLAEQVENMGRMSIAFNNIGICEYYLGAFDEAKRYFQLSLEMKRNTGNRFGISTSLQNLGIISFYQGEFEETAVYFHQALPIKLELGDRAGEGDMLHNLAALYHKLGLHDKAMAHYEKAITVSQEIGYQHGLALTWHNLGLLYHHLGQQAVAEKYCQQALDLARDINTLADQANSLINLGHIFTAQDRSTEAVKAFLQAISMRRQSKQENLAVEAAAGLLNLLPTETPQDENWLETVWNHLDSEGTDGMLEPSRVQLSCYHALVKQEDPRAKLLLQKAHAQLTEQAAKLLDPATKQSFLSNVTAHREIILLYERIN